MMISDGACRNRLLVGHADDYAHVSRHLEPVSMSLGEVLHEPCHPMSYAHFPTTAIASLLDVMHDGAAAAVAVVGYEGVVRISLFMGGESSPSRSVVHSTGHGFRMKAQILKDAFARAGPLQRLLLLYTQALLTQMAQTAVCSRHHSLDQQLCRRLLLSLDRLPGNELVIIQQYPGVKWPLHVGLKTRQPTTSVHDAQDNAQRAQHEARHLRGLLPTDPFSIRLAQKTSHQTNQRESPM